MISYCQLAIHYMPITYLYCNWNFFGPASPILSIPHPLLLPLTSLFSVSMSSLKKKKKKTLHKWILQYLSFLSLILLSIMPIIVHSCCNKCQDFIPFLWLSNICVCVCVSECVCTLYPFIHLWTIDCFHILALVNTAAVNMQVCISFWVSVFIFFT